MYLLTQLSSHAFHFPFSTTVSSLGSHGWNITSLSHNIQQQERTILTKPCQIQCLPTYFRFYACIYLFQILGGKKLSVLTPFTYAVYRNLFFILQLQMRVSGLHDHVNYMMEDSNTVKSAVTASLSRVTRERN